MKSEIFTFQNRKKLIHKQMNEYKSENIWKSQRRTAKIKNKTKYQYKRKYIE